MYPFIRNKKKNGPGVLIVLIFLLCGMNVFSETIEESPKAFWDWNYMTGNWNGTRTRISDLGIDWEFVYSGEVSGNASGGLRRKTEYLDNADLTLAFDAEKLMNWKGASFFIYGLGNHGGSPSENVGDAQTLSNIDADDTLKIYELWFQQNLFGEKLSILAGLYDLNSEFDVVETGGLFFNSSHGIGPDFSQSGKNGPSIFPTTSVGLRIRVQPVDTFYLQAVVLDGVPGDPDNPLGTHIIFHKEDGLLAASEIAYLTGTEEDSDSPYGKYAIGTWYYTKEFDDVVDVDTTGEPVKRKGNYGIYAIAEQSVYQEKADHSQGLTLYVRLGTADIRINRVQYYTGGGFVYSGLIPARDADQVGFAIAVAHNSKRLKDAMLKAGASIDSSEVAMEFSYAIEITPWFGIQPDFQYIINPDTNPDVDDAFAIGMRFQISI